MPALHGAVGAARARMARGRMRLVRAAERITGAAGTMLGCSVMPAAEPSSERSGISILIGLIDATEDVMESMMDMPVTRWRTWYVDSQRSHLGSHR